MKIRNVTPEYLPKALGLLRRAFPDDREARLVESLHNNGKTIHDWVCIHINKVIGYIGFTNAYHGSEVCGLHLAPLAVKEEFRNQEIGAGLVRFALRQDVIKSRTLFVLGDPGYYRRFGFEPCDRPICPFDKKNEHFMSIRNVASSPFTVRYEKEFSLLS